MITIINFSRLLDEHSILKIEAPVWEKIEVFHGTDCLQHYQINKLQEIRTYYKDKLDHAGVYAYFNDQACMYIGITKDLRERLYQHLLESCDIWGHLRYRDYFSKWVGKIDLYFLPLGDHSKEGDYLRSITEKILQVHYDPELKSIKL